MNEQYQIKPKDQEAGVQIPASFILQNHYPPKENTMSKFVSFVAGALTGAAAMVGLAFWISEQDGATDSIPTADQEGTNEAQDQASQEDHAQGQEAGDDFEEAVPTI